jgi:glyoxylase-like metal-dependent hydrolase (beta-lactamase superfamily II)
MSPVRGVASAVQGAIGGLFDGAVDFADDVQRRTVDLAFDAAALTPVEETLHDVGILQPSGGGCQVQPELAFLEAVNDNGPAGATLCVISMVVLYTSLKRERDGIDRLESYLTKFAKLTPAQKSIYLTSLALLRAGLANRLPLWDLPETLLLLQQMYGNLSETRNLTENLPDFTPDFAKLFARWTNGVLMAKLPWPLGNHNQALQDLLWCENTINENPLFHENAFQFLREVYYSRAILARDNGDQKTAQEFLRKSGFKDFSSKNLFLATIFAATSDGVRDGPQQVKEAVPGKLFTVSGFDLSDYNFILTEDGQQLIAVDSGSRVDRCEAAYRLFEQRFNEIYGKAPPLLTNVFMTHYHWDHTGGYPFFQQLNPGLVMHSRSNYTEERERAANQPPPWDWILGERFDEEPVAFYRPTKTIDADTEMTIGDTNLRLILLPGGGGETPDGMFIYLPQHRVLYVGDFVVPWVGSPYVVEGDADSLLNTIEVIAKLDPRPKELLHGHWAVTQFYPTPDPLISLKPHLEWLKKETLRLIYENKNRVEIQQMNLIPPNILDPSEAAIQVAFVSMREVMIDRLCHQHIGYWGPQLQGVDSLGEAQYGSIFSKYLKMSAEQVARVIRDMIGRGDFELAGKVADWAATQFPNSAVISDAQRDAYLQLKQKWQLLNVFKFAMYSEHVGDPTPQLDEKS